MTVHKHMSLSVYNRPKDMAVRRPKTATAQHDLLKRMVGYKQPAGALSVGPDGQPEAAPEPVATEPILPPIEGISNFEQITKDAIDC